jgi:benzoylformate decarboxylase
MQNLVEKLLDQKLSRRNFGKAMGALGFSASAIESIVQSVAYAAEAPSGQGFEFVGNGGEVLAECLKAAGVEFVFNANSTGQGTFYDALSVRPELNLIVALHEGQATSMAEGYELASGKTTALVLPSIGMPNAASNLYNAWKDRSALAVFSDGQSTSSAGRDGFQQADDWLQPTEQVTKWRWQVGRPERIGEMVRRGIKLAGTPPGGPVYVRLPKNILRSTDLKQTIYPQSNFEVPLQMEPRAELIDQAARLLLESSNPMINAGGEITRARANEDLIELAELLSIPVAQGHSVFGDFPFKHPLFCGFSVGATPRGVRQTDVYLNLGGDMPDSTNFGSPVPKQATVINARIEYDKIANLYPVDLAIAAGVKETTRALIDAIEGMATKTQIRKIRGDRLEISQAANIASDERRRKRSAKTWNDSPIAAERFFYEADQALADDAIIVPESSGRSAYYSMNFALGRKTVIGPATGFALGWSVGASLGVKIARPDHQVVCLVGDGAMLFGQLESLWTASRYNIPVIIVIMNNRSYDSERQALFMTSQVVKKNEDLWKDMACYLGDPVVDFIKIADGFDIGGERITRPDNLKAGFARAAAVIREGRPYVIEAVIARQGKGADSTWHPEISIADRRTRKI